MLLRVGIASASQPFPPAIACLASAKGTFHVRHGAFEAGQRMAHGILVEGSLTAQATPYSSSQSRLSSEEPARCAFEEMVRISRSDVRIKSSSKLIGSPYVAV